MTNLDISNLNAAHVASTASTTQIEAPATMAATQSTSVLSGDSLTVTNAFSDLEKLLAQLKEESADTRSSVAQQRLAAVLDVLKSLSAEQAAALEAVSGYDAEIASLMKQLESLNSTLETQTGRSAELDVLIDQLEKMVQQNIEDGKIHRQNVQELKELRAEQAAKLAALEENLSALEKADVRDEAAIAAAQAAVANAQTALATTDSKIASETSAAEASETKAAGYQVQLDSAKSEKATVAASIAETAKSIETLNTQISALQSKISKAFASLGESALASLAAALTADAKAATVTDGDKPQSPADVQKEILKEIETNPLRVVREAMDRVGELLEELKEIDSNQPVKA